MEWFKALLEGTEGAEAIVEAFNKEFPKHAVPKEQYNKKVGELTDLTTRYSEAETQIKTLTDSQGDSEQLKSELDKIKGDFETYKTDTEKRKVNRDKIEKLQEKLSKAINPDALDLVVSKLNPDELNLNEAGEVVDGDAIVKRIVDSRPGLAIKIDTSSPKPNGTPKPGEEVDFSKMSDSEYFRYKEEQKGE